MGTSLLLLAATTGYQTRTFAEAARRLGLRLILGTDRCHLLEDAWGDGSVAVRFEKPVASLRALHGLEFDAIVAVGDRPTLLAAHIAEARGIPYHTPASVRACRNKYLARQLFQAAGLPVPGFFTAWIGGDPGQAAARATYPCVLKPLGLSGSRGVIRANEAHEFRAAFGRIRALLESPDIRIMGEEQYRHIQVETFIPGREFALEGLVSDGQLQTLAIFDKPDPLDGPFFEETIYVTPSREDAATQQELIEGAQRGVRALNLVRGPVHIEMRVNESGVWLLEIATRPIGGLCAHALAFEAGMPLEELILRHAIGEDVSHARLESPATGVMMIPIPRAGIYQGVSGVEGAGEEVIITAKEGQRLVPLPEGSSYLGFIFARGETPEAVEARLRRAHAKLHFHIATALETMK